MATVAPATPSTPVERDSTKPQAMAIPKEGYFKTFKTGGTAHYIQDSSLLRIHHHCEDQTGKGGCDPYFW